jgi:SAM-dependent methyltransferase
MPAKAGAPVVCLECGRVLPREQGMFRCLDAEQRARIEPFLAQYRVVRQQDGYRADRPEYYRALPRSAPDDAQAGVWRIRQRTFERLRREILARWAGSAPAVLELGAGSGWLCHRLAALGCRTVAVDLIDDEQDGLGACRHYDESFARVQADFDRLPFAPHQFDFVVFNGSLHYAPDVAATLKRAERMLARGGWLIVADSPTFVDPGHGVAMTARQRERLRRQCGVETPVQPGEGFLTLSRLQVCAAEMGRSPRFLETDDGWRSRLRRIAAAAGRRRPVPPRFGLWIAA